MSSITLLGLGASIIFCSSALAGVFQDGVRVQNSNGGALGSVAGNLDSDPADEFVSGASSNSSDPHFRIYDYSPSSGVWTKYNILSSSTVDSTMQDRFGTDIVIADVDGDGRNDIALVDSSDRGNTGRMLWFKNPGSLGGSWAMRTVTTWTGSGTGGSVRHSEIAAGDINADGHQDLVARDTMYGVWVLIQASPFDGTKWHTRKFISANPREGVALADIDKDGDLDIVINGVWFQTPSDPVNGTYTKRTYASAWYPSAYSSDAQRDYACQVRTADFDRDGDTDIVITNAEELNNASSTASKPLGIRVYLRPNNPLTEPWKEVILHTKYFSWHSCELSDFDRDGDIDIVSGISLVGVDTAAPLVMLFKNNGSGTAFAQETIDTGSEGGTPVYIYQPSAGDYDNDGDDDLFAPNNWDSGPIWIYKNQSAGAPISSRPSAPTNVRILSSVN